MMGNYNDFSFLQTMSIEIGSSCNLQHMHKCCPINCRQKVEKELTVEEILHIMDEAIQLNFQGLFAFHFYNEPLLYADKILQLKEQRPNYKFLLWTNGTLIDKLLKEEYDFNIFDRIVITKYKGIDATSFYQLKNLYQYVEIYEEDMDDRLNFYESKKENYISCKKIYVELPIDCEGNVYICTYDWDKKYLLGNVLEQKLEDILKSDSYQNLLKGNEKRFRHIEDINDLCKYCPRPYIIRK